MRTEIITLAFIIFTLSVNVICYTQISSDSIDGIHGEQEIYQELSDELDFGETRKVWKLKENEDNHVPTSFNRNNFQFNGSALNVLAYMMIVVLILTVIYLVFSNVKKEKQISNENDFAIEIEDLEEIDASQGFKQAIMISDYRSAIRMQFIKVLQMLQEGSYIQWRPEKTNRDYLAELTSTKFRSKFRELAGIYELVWYGNTSIDQTHFNQLNPVFDQFINQDNG